MTPVGVIRDHDPARRQALAGALDDVFSGEQTNGNSRRYRAIVVLMLLFLAVDNCRAEPAASAIASATGPASRPALALFARTNLLAWCIVPYDGRQRTPSQRAEMLSRIGLRKFAYDWRAQHLPSFETELDELKKHEIELTGVWFPDHINKEARFILDCLAKHHVHTQLWVTSWAKDGDTQESRVKAAAERMRVIADEAAKIGCTLALYNHGGWFGEPENQIAIIQRLKSEGINNVGIVYSLHHGYGDLDRFPGLFNKMLPYLLAVNLNGMTKIPPGAGEPVVPVGHGSLDVALLKVIANSGYRGPIGLINESNEDAEGRLLDNIEGLDWLRPQIDGEPAADRPQARTWHDPAALEICAAGHASLSPEFGQALAGELVVEGKPEYRTPPITVECRAMLRGKAGYNILIASDTKASAAHWELFTLPGSGKLTAYLPGHTPDHVRGDADICDGHWHYLAMQFEPSRVRLYADGKVVVDTVIKSKGGAPLPGALAFGRVVEGGLSCDGLIDDVRISRGIREIGPTPAHPQTRDEQTIGLWDFNELGAASSAVDHWSVEDAKEREKLPFYKTIPASPADDLTQANGWPGRDEYANWYRSHGNDASTRYSPLAQINRENVRSLKEAWTYHSHDGKGNVQCNPVIVDGIVYAPTVGNCVVAINGQTGDELWRFTPKGRPAHRGLTYYKGTETLAPRLLFAAGNALWSLDPATGKPIESFGNHGSIEIPPCVVSPAIYQNVIVFAGWNLDVFGVELTTGKPLWTFHTIPQPGEPYADTWDGRQSGANVWGGMSLDASRGIAYVSTGSPKPNFFGVGHLGDNLFGNCVLAIDVTTGMRLWHFQEIRHDIWDLDGAAPPLLVTVTIGGRRVDAVAAVTKVGNTLLLDRVTGKPLFPFRLRRAPASTLRGERTALYQPDLQLPEPFSRQVFTKADVTNLSKRSHDFVLDKISEATFGWFAPFEEGKPLAMFGIHGGAEWTGGAFDPDTNLLYVSSNELPWLPAVYRSEHPAVDETKVPPTAGRLVYQVNCMPCHGPSREGMGMAPSLLGVSHRLAEDQILLLLKTGRGAMPAALLDETQKKDLLNYVMGRDRPDAKVIDRPERPSYRDSGYPKLLDPDGYPGCTPPWGLLNAINLNTGRIAWRVPLGEYPELIQRGIPKTGTENFGGPIATAGGLVFCAGTRDLKIRAFDKTTGEELWSHPLPFGGFAPPATYQANGKQYLIIPATGGGKLDTPMGDAYVAFTLP